MFQKQKVLKHSFGEDLRMNNSISLTDILATIAIFISIISLITSVYIENKKLKRESDAKFFQDIYYSYMKIRIPKVESSIDFDRENNKITGINEMVNLLQALRKKTTPYKYIDKIFYDKFINFLLNTEDFYIAELNTVRDKQKFENFQNKSLEKMEALYRILNNKFQNKKIQNIN